MPWSLVNEIGIEYAPLSPERSHERLCFPIYAERAADGTYLIVDELAQEKGVPMRTEFRTIRVAADRSVIYDSMERGIDDGFGCLTADGLTALLRLTRWELLILSPTGSVLRRIGLSTFSKRMPVAFSSTGNNTFLIAFLDKLFEVDIIEIDQYGRLLWYLPKHVRTLGYPASLQLLPNGNILIADEFGHVAAEITRSGSVAWQHGQRRNPSPDLHALSSPRAVCALPDGTRLVADARNHRILSISPTGQPTPLRHSLGDLSSPAFVSAVPDGHTLICDAGNARVVELDGRGQPVWQYGHSTTSRRWLSYPRSVEVTAGGRFLICDTAHDRIVRARGQAMEPWPVDHGTRLFWPRCVRPASPDSILIADGRNSRILEVTADGSVRRELHTVHLSGELSLKDPHDVRALPGDQLLIVDPGHNLVVEADWSGRVHWAAGHDPGIRLDDPHSAQRLPDGHVLICDTGNHRIIRVDRSGCIVEEQEGIHSRSSCYKLNRPRYAEVSRDGVMVVVDTGNNRVLAADPTGQLLWELSTVASSPLPFLNQPRWAQLPTSNELVITDHCHHRILHFKAGVT